MRNRNHQPRANYADCIKAQVVFLHEQDGSPSPDEFDPADPDLAHDLAAFYDNGVSVDAAASDLFHRGF